jgi:hypothetical protein
LLAAGVGIEPTSRALTGRRIALMLTGKNKNWSGARDSHSYLTVWKTGMLLLNTSTAAMEGFV